MAEEYEIRKEGGKEIAYKKGPLGDKRLGELKRSLTGHYIEGETLLNGNIPIKRDLLPVNDIITSIGGKPVTEEFQLFGDPNVRKYVTREEEPRPLKQSEGERPTDGLYKGVDLVERGEQPIEPRVDTEESWKVVSYLGYALGTFILLGLSPESTFLALIGVFLTGFSFIGMIAMHGFWRAYMIAVLITALTYLLALGVALSLDF